LKPELVKKLLQAGANIETRDKRGNSALLIAIKRVRDLEIIEMLFEAGASSQNQNKRYENAFNIFLKREDSLCIDDEDAKESHSKIFELLLSQGVNLNHKDRFGRGALTNSARQLPEVQEKVLTLLSEIDDKDCRSFTSEVYRYLKDLDVDLGTNTTPEALKLLAKHLAYRHVV